MDDFDVIIIGGGLVGGLTAYRCREIAPTARVLLVERGDRFGANHTWSFHEPDLQPSDLEWVRPFVAGAWDSQTVYFPRYRRELKSRYYSVSSSQFHSVLAERIGESGWLRTRVTSLTSHTVEIEGKGTLRARRVLDARGILSGPRGRFGYQKFLGQDLLLEGPHGLMGPILMDARVAQKDGYRFFYALPWTTTSLLLEDTRYSDSSQVHADECRQEIRRYVEARGWKVQSVLREEQGSLPIPFTRRLPWGPLPNSIGVRAGLFHPTTGYSFPDAVATAERIARQTAQGDFPRPLVWKRTCHRVVRRRWFYRLLNRMFFQGVAPERRYLLLERFYRLPLGTIQRFYAARLHPWEYLMVLFWGRPPVPMRSAVNCFAEPKESHV